MASNSSLLLLTGLSVAGLVLLIVRFKVSAFIALIAASLFMGLAAGMEPAKVLKAFQDGVGATLGTIAMIIGLGTILGKILAETGGAEVIAQRLLALFGPKRLTWAFLAIALVVGLPVFFQVGLVLLVPLLYAISRQNKIPLLRLGIPLIAGLSAAHCFTPPHPGPLAAIAELKANLGKTLLLSLPVAAISGCVAGPLFARLFSDQQLEVTGDLPITASRRNLPAPGFWLTLANIILPLALMTLGAFVGLLPGGEGSRLRWALTAAGHPITALLIGVVFSFFTLARNARFSRDDLLRMSEEALGPVAVILLVIGAGAGFSRVLIESGVGKAIAEIAVRWSLPVLPMSFVLAAVIRVATGSSTVAITTCAGLVKTAAEAQPGTNLELLVLAMGAGSLALSHVNDGGFWLVKSYLNLSVPRTLKTWSVAVTLSALTGFGCVLLLDWLL